MQNRRAFLETSVVMSASAVVGAPTVSALLNESSEAEPVFLGRLLEHWLEIWRSGTPDVWAARAVVEFGPRAVPALLEMLPRTRPSLPTQQLASVIARIATDHPQVIDHLLELAEGDFFRAAEVLRRCCGQHPYVVRFFLHIILTEDCPRKQATALCALGYDGDKSEFIRRADFAQAVSRFIEQAVMNCNEAFENTIRHGLESAWYFIPDLECPAAEKIRLCELLIQISVNHGDLDLYFNPTMLERLGPTTSPTLAQFATSQDPRNKDEEIERLIDAAMSSLDFDSQFAQLIRADDEDVAIQAIFRVQALQLDTPKILEALGQTLRSPGQTNWRRRHVACKALATLGSKALPTAIAALNDEYTEVRRDAIHLLGLLGPAAKSVLPALRFHWHQGDPRHREALLWAMIAISPDEWLLPFIHEGLEAWHDPDLCTAAVSGLYQFGPLDNRQFLPKLLRMLTSHHNQLQELAAQSISRCGNHWLSEVLKLLDSTEPLARVGAIRALGNCPLPAPQEALAALRRLLNDYDLAVRHQAHEAFGRACGT